MKRRHSDLGRKAIEALKVMYRDGAEFTDSAVISTELIRTLDARPKDVTLRRVSEWDRQARYELARDDVAVTPPVRRLGHERSARATPSKRNMTMGDRSRELLTRISNQSLIADSHAAQPDAKAQEIRRSERLRVLKVIAREIVMAGDDDSGAVVQVAAD